LLAGNLSIHDLRLHCILLNEVSMPRLLQKFQAHADSSEFSELVGGSDWHTAKSDEYPRNQHAAQSHSVNRKHSAVQHGKT
jgi:hypothetical protein